MKTILVLLILFSVIALPALGELTDADLNEIRLIVKDEIAASEKRFDTKIQASEDSMKAHMTQQGRQFENTCRMAYRYPCGCDSTHRYSFSCFDNHDRLAKR